MTCIWNYRIALDPELCEDLEAWHPEIDPELLLRDETLKLRISRYWAAFLYEDEIWLGCREKIYRLRKSDGRLVNTFVIPAEYFTLFGEACVLPLRPIGYQMVIFGVVGRRQGATEVLPFVLDFSPPGPTFHILDALEAVDSPGTIDWSVQLSEEISPFQRPLVGEVDVSGTRSIYEFVVLNLANLIEQKRMAIVCEDSRSQRTRCADFPFAATDNCYNIAWCRPESGLAPQTICKLIRLGDEELSVDFREKTHVSFGYSIP